MDEKNEGVEELDPKAPVDQKDEGIDYKAELEKERAEKENYKQGMLDAKDILKGKGIITDPDEIAKIIESKVEEKMNIFALNFAKSTFEDSLTSLSGSEAEKELIRYHYDNTIQKSGLDPVSIRNDLENAKLLANKKSLFKQSKEMEIALANKAGMSGAGQGSGGGDNLKLKEDFFSETQILELKKRGFTDDKIVKLKENMLKAKER